MMKKMIALVLSVVLVCAAFVGCGDKKESNDTGSQTTEATQKEAGEEKSDGDIVGVWTMVSMKGGGQEMDVEQYLKSNGQDKAPKFEFKENNEFVMTSWASGDAYKDLELKWEEKDGKYVATAAGTEFLKFTLKGDKLEMGDDAGSWVFEKE